MVELYVYFDVLSFSFVVSVVILVVAAVVGCFCCCCYCLSVLVISLVCNVVVKTVRLVEVVHFYFV